MLSTVQLNMAVRYYNDLMDVFYEYIEIPDQDFLKIILAVALHSAIPDHTSMLWIALVGPQSTGKTLFGSDILQELKARSYAINIDMLTSKTFLSGLKSGTDLLPKLNRKLVLLKDMSTISATDKITLSGLFSQLRNIYDGHISSYWGSDKSNAEYSTIFDLIGCITDKGWSIIQDTDAALGERMIPIRQRITSDQNLIIRTRAMKNAGKEKKYNTIISNAVMEYIDKMSDIIPEYSTVELDKSVTMSINSLSILSDKARTVLEYEYTSKNGRIPVGRIYNPSGARVNRNVTTLIQIIAVINGRNKITNEELKIARRIYYSLIPNERMYILQVLHKTTTTAKEISDNLLLSEYVAKRLLDDMVSLEMVKQQEIDKRLHYFLTIETRNDINSSNIFNGGVVSKDMGISEITKLMMFPW